MSKILLCSLACSLGLSICPSHKIAETPTPTPAPLVEQQNIVYYEPVVIHEKLTYIEEKKEPSYVYTTTNLNVRTSPKISNNIVETLPKNTKLEKLEDIEYGWVSINVNDNTYYICGNYITEEEPEEIITLESLEPIRYSIGENENKIIFEDCLGEYTLTAYCACEKCCGKWSKYKKTASGTTPEQGRTVACVSLDFGTIININGEDYIVEDTGHLEEKQIDIYFESHEEAREFGRQKEIVYLVKDAEKNK